jgi:hypothetical protein
MNDKVMQRKENSWNKSFENKGCRQQNMWFIRKQFERAFFECRGRLFYVEANAL